MKEILRAKSKTPTEKECYEELVKVIRIYCYQSVVREEIGFFQKWLKNILMQLSEYASSPDEPEKYPAYKELRRKASEFVREPTEDPSRVMSQRTELKAALEKRREGGRVSSAVTEAENAGKGGETSERVKGYRTREAPQKED